MATETLHYDQQAIDAAREAVEKARKEFSKQLEDYLQFGNSLAEDLANYRQSRKRWIL